MQEEQQSGRPGICCGPQGGPAEAEGQEQGATHWPQPLPAVASGRSCHEPRMPRRLGRPGTHSPMAALAAGRHLSSQPSRRQPQHMRQASCWSEQCDQDLHAHEGLGRGWSGALSVCQTQGDPLAGLGWILCVPPPHEGPWGGSRQLDASWKEGLKIALLPAPASLPAVSGQVTGEVIWPPADTHVQRRAWKNRSFLSASP